MGEGLMRSYLAVLVVALHPLVGPSVRAQDMKELFTLKGHKLPVSCVALRADHKFLVSGAGDGIAGELKLWDLTSGKEVDSFPGHTSGVGAVALSPDGRHIASSDRREEVWLWDAASGKRLSTLKSPIDGVT